LLIRRMRTMSALVPLVLGAETIDLCCVRIRFNLISSDQQTLFSLGVLLSDGSIFKPRSFKIFIAV
jgi:hypothetical protein